MHVIPRSAVSDGQRREPRSRPSFIRRLHWTALVCLLAVLLVATLTAAASGAPDGESPVVLVAAWGALACAIATGILALQARRAGARLRRLVTRVREIARADLDRDQRIVIGSRDELGEIADHVNLALERYRQLFSALRDASAHLEGAMNGGSTGQLRAIELSRKQSDDSASLSAGLDELARSIQRAAHDLSETSQRMSASAEIMKDGSDRVRGSREGMEQLLAGIARVQGLLEALGLRSQEIGAVMQSIVGITTQTQLVSLNASIEAARAGAAGEGFAVVADELRKLAEGSRRAAEQVTRLMSTIREEASAAAAQVGELHRVAEENRDRTMRASERIDELLATSRRIHDSLSQISSAVELQSVTSEQIAGAFDPVVGWLERNLDQARDAASAHEILAARIGRIHSLLQG